MSATNIVESLKTAIPYGIANREFVPTPSRYPPYAAEPAIVVTMPVGVIERILLVSATKMFPEEDVAMHLK
jgi:hypothetical protein